MDKLIEIFQRIQEEFQKLFKEPKFEYYTRVLSSGEITSLYSTECDSIRMIESTGGNDDIEISINQKSFFQFRQGLEYKTFGRINNFVFKNTSSNSVTIRYTIANGQVNDSTLRLTGAIKINQGGSISDSIYALVDKTAHKIIDSATLSQNWATLQNNNVSGNIYVGGEGLADASALGIKLIPGAVRDYALTGDIWARADASNLSINIQYGE